MKNYFKQIFSASLLLIMPYLTFAQNGNFAQDVKDIMNEYMIPILLIGMVLAAGGGFLYNLDDFVDKKGDGTRSKALVNIGWIVGIAFVSILGIIAIINFVSSKQVQL